MVVLAGITSGTGTTTFGILARLIVFSAAVLLALNTLELKLMFPDHGPRQTAAHRAAAVRVSAGTGLFLRCAVGGRTRVVDVRGDYKNRRAGRTRRFFGKCVFSNNFDYRGATGRNCSRKRFCNEKTAR